MKPLQPLFHYAVNYCIGISRSDPSLWIICYAIPEHTALTDEQNNLMLLLTKQISAMLAMEQQNEQLTFVNG